MILMDIPVLNKGFYLYSVKLNVTEHEAQWLLEYNWHKIHGQPKNPSLGYIFNLISLWRNDNEILYFNDKSLIPLYKNSKCVAYAQIDPEDYDDLIRHKWYITNEGYAEFYNPVLKKSYSMHRYLMNFPTDLVIDHTHWNRLDNRKSMLRICTRSENSKNLSHKRFSNLADRILKLS